MDNFTEEFLNTVDYDQLKEAYWRRKAEKDEPERLRQEEAIRQRRVAALLYLNSCLSAFMEANFRVYNLPPLDEHQASKLCDMVYEYAELG